MTFRHSDENSDALCQQRQFATVNGDAQNENDVNEEFAYCFH